MAYISQFVCTVCNEPRHEVVVASGVCASCRRAEAIRARRTHLASLLGLTVEERLARLEAIQYDEDAGRRLDALEAMNARY